jgi:hypothetical protein
MDDQRRYNLNDADSNAVVVEWLHNGTGSISVKEKKVLGCDTTVSVNNILINERPVPVYHWRYVVCRNTDGPCLCNDIECRKHVFLDNQRRYHLNGCRLQCSSSGMASQWHRQYFSKREESV